VQNEHKSLISEWFFDNFELILDELQSINDLKYGLIDGNDEAFEDIIEHQAYDEFIRSIIITCSSKLGLSYDVVYDGLEDKLEEMFNAFN
jgi:hypothetical protein